MRAVDRMDFGSVRISPDYRLPSHTLTSIKFREDGWTVVRSLNREEGERVQRKRQRRVKVALQIGACAVVLVLAWFGVLVPMAQVWGS